ncbi:MAG: glycosyltransferase family 39 protein [Candidatus Berkelbacteria bacterium]|nr:glycosyltransferase family 39 protein [Candidatus Berkelbacteria bacterium]
MNAPNKRRLIYLAVLLAIISLSATLRIENWSDFLIYPDSYRYLLAAKDQLVVFDKPLFVYLIKLVGLATGNLELSGHLIVICVSLASIPLLYFALSKYFGRRIALISCFLFGISFSHIVWSGYIMPDALAVFLYIISLFFLLEYPLICGFFLLLAVLVRPEYILLFVPAAFFYLLKKKGRRILGLLPGISLSVLFMVLSKPDLSTVFILKPGSAEFIYNFLSGDFLIIFLGLLGMFYLYKKEKDWLLYFLSSLILLVLIYQITSPSNWRYGTHLLVGLSVPAAFFINRLVEGFPQKGIFRLGMILILVAVVGQIVFSFRGIRSNHPELSYETVSASKIKTLVQLPDLLILSYYNEAYAWHLDKKAISFDEVSCQEEIILIEDQPTRDFSSLELQELKDGYELTELGSFWVNQGYFYKNKIYLEKAPVVLYLAKREDGEKTSCNNSGL